MNGCSNLTDRGVNSFLEIRAIKEDDKLYNLSIEEHVDPSLGGLKTISLDVCAWLTDDAFESLRGGI